MSYQIEFLEEAANDWKNLDYSVRKKLEKSIERLKISPIEYGKLLGRTLHGLRRVRSGDYRIVYRVHESSKMVEIGVVCHRKDVYKIALKRHLV